ncbi:hypothetical protein DOJK_02408 [Patescibacteria group bacterium]|nr:hypothetical protein DOJK_02408 [Patescibacteria group bacterium]
MIIQSVWDLINQTNNTRNLNAMTLPVIQIRQNNFDLLLFSIDAKYLLSITYVQDRISYQDTGIQRPASHKRTSEIAAYIEEDDSALPNSIIINLELDKLGLTLSDVIDNNQIDFDIIIKQAEIKKQDKDKIAFIIDGQHRLRAFEYVNKPFNIVVTAFIDLTLAEVAELFVKINYYQTKVNRSQVYDLLGIQPNIFPEYYQIHEAIEKLNTDTESPFYQNIKMLGIGQGIISQASIISAFVKYKLHVSISDIFKSTDSETMFSILWYFFKAIQDTYPGYWGGKNNMLSKSIGIRALLRLLKDILNEFGNDSTAANFDIAYVKKYIAKLPPDFWILDHIRGLTGESGVNKIYDSIKSIIR